MRTHHPLLPSLLLLALRSPLAASAPSSNAATPEWTFVKNGSTGIVPTQAIVVSPTLILMFDRAQHNPLMINNHSAWAALWNLETNTALAVDAITDSFCGSGSILSNGSMVSVGGMHIENPDDVPDQDGRMSIRIFEPCEDAAGVGCTLFDDPEVLALNTTRWYPSSLRIFDGSLMVVGGTHDVTPFYNVDPVNSFEFFPKKDGGAVRESAFLQRAVPVNLFPRVFSLPDGRVFMVANNRSIIYDIEKNTETILPDIPNGVRITNPMDGSAQLLALSPPNYTPEVLVCGGSTSNEAAANLTAEDPATDQCSRITLTDEGIQQGWQVEHMLEPRVMPEIILLPNGQLLITNGGETGYAAIASVSLPVGNVSNCDHPVLTPSLYTPDAPLGQRISNAGMPTTDIGRLYHSAVTLTPSGNIFIAGSNPNQDVSNGTEFFNTQWQVEYLNPPYMFVERPTLGSFPAQIAFNQNFTVNITVPANLAANSTQVSLMDLGFSSHAFHSSNRLVFLEHTLSADRSTLTLTSPPNNRIYPPGPAFVYFTVDNVTSEAVMVMVGNGESPPVADQGVPVQIS